MLILSFIMILTLLIWCVVMILASVVAKKNNYGSSKKYTLQMWAWSYSFCSTTIFLAIFFNWRNFFFIYDVEITLILPVAYILELSNVYSSSGVGLFFILIFLLGLYYEWAQGALEWS